MEPRIRYAKTEDGVSIAYSVCGEGPPLVFVAAWPFCHLDAEWSLPTWRHLDEQLAARTRLVRFDGRGAGLSQRDVEDLSLEARVLDLEAVVNHLELASFDLSGYGTGGPVAIEYAARHPKRVDHLILSDTYARTADFLAIPAVEGLVAMANSDWNTFTEAASSVVFGWAPGEEARKMAVYIRECVTREQGLAALATAMNDFDLTARLAEVQAPTLVSYNREAAFTGVDVARSLASAVPDATLAAIDGTWITTNESAEACAKLLLEFIGVGGERLAPGQPAKAATNTILFTDMASSTTLADQLGDSKAQEVRPTHNEIVRSALSANGGSEIKHTGDGIMATFTTASSALACAIAIQQGVASHKEEHPDSPLGVYIGLNAGEPIAEDDDLFGTSVDLAARLVDHAQPGQIIASDVVRQLAAGKDFLFSDLGETALRGFEDPVKLWELRWQEG